MKQKDVLEVPDGIEKPKCFNSESGHVCYPLCSGVKNECEKCCLYVDFEPLEGEVF